MNYYFPIAWATLALINAAIAQTKNRSAANWLLSSLALGPVATGLLVILNVRQMTPEAIERQQKIEKASSWLLIILIFLVIGAMVGFLLSAKLMSK